MKKLDHYLVKSSGPFPPLSKLSALIVVGLVAWACAAGAATNTVTVNDDGVSNIGAVGTFYWAITNCSAGDTIAFNIPGAGPHYLQEPPGGFPIVYKKYNLVIDGYTQPGSSANTHSITQANNAVIKIVIDGRNGNSANMEYTTYGSTVTTVPPIDNSSMIDERAGYANTERALLPIYRSTNVTVRGLAFLSTFHDPTGDQKGICFAHDYGLDTNVLNRLAYTNGSDANCHVCGCWFGVDPTNQTVAGVSGGLMAIANYRHRDVNGGPRPDLPNVGLIVGVAPGSPNPRAEFNVFVGYGYIMDSENIRARFSGNFCGVMPDGVTAYNMPDQDPTDFNNAGNGFFEWGRWDDTEPMIIGTDGDGVNDADEGNLFGPLDLINGNQANIFDFYSTGRKPYIIAGNRFGIAVDGTIWHNNSFCIFGGLSLNQGTQVRFGSDFNGVSDALEANIVYNNNVFSTLWPDPTSNDYGVPAPPIFQGMQSSPGSTMDAWVSVRGNVMVNNFPVFDPDPALSGGSPTYFMNWWSNYVTFTSDTPGATNAIPTLASGSTISKLIGTFAPITTNGYTNVVLDLYVPDPQGETNGALFSQPSFGGNWATPGGWGFVQGQTYLGSYLIPNPASGVFSLDISGLGLAHGTPVTAAITYSAFARPKITSITRAGNSTTLAWSGSTFISGTNEWTSSNGGPFYANNSGSPTAQTSGAPSSGFGVQTASSLKGPWTTSYAPSDTIVLPDSAQTAFYRIVSPLSGMTTLFAPPLTLP
jgi:hypothetical protein